ncbi:MAG: hypothetical protein H7331_05870 [Bacteroidia bacterium]|nr:hypothetical protein [Bacteroidia bacterium]
MTRINEASNFYKHTSHEACGSAKLEIHAGGSGAGFTNLSAAELILKYTPK